MQSGIAVHSRTLVVTIALGLALLAPGVCSAAGASCDRACLLATADGYLGKLAGHTASSLRTDRGFVFTENNTPLPLGDALWKTINKVGAAPIHVIDTKTGQVGLFVEVDESDRPALLAARLALRNGQLNELDTVVARQESASFLKPEGFANEAALMEAPLAAAERRPRAELSAIATTYFRNLVDSDAALPEFDETCNRVENGVQSTNNPVPAGSPSGSTLNAPFSSLGCLEQFKTRSLTFVSGIRGLSYPLIDEDTGVVFASLIFDHNGLVRRGSPAGQLSVKLPSPYSFLVRELFKIRNGRIVHIDAVITSVPYGTQPVWQHERMGAHLP